MPLSTTEESSNVKSRTFERHFQTVATSLVVLILFALLQSVQTMSTAQATITTDIRWMKESIRTMKVQLDDAATGTYKKEEAIRAESRFEDKIRTIENRLSIIENQMAIRRRIKGVVP